uniref:Uncharacterized protein n=1 Tax=Sphaerodactylus townsendi TaxID=933632 RepID=A0ACB8ENK6_9SAUR
MKLPQLRGPKQAPPRRQLAEDQDSLEACRGPLRISTLVNWAAQRRQHQEDISHSQLEGQQSARDQGTRWPAQRRPPPARPSHHKTEKTMGPKMRS